VARRGMQDLTKEQFWRRMVGLWRRSTPAVTVRDFCAEHGLSEPSFYSWRRTLAQRDGKIQATPRQLGKGPKQTQTLDRPQDEQPAFVPLTVLPSSPSPPAAPLELVLPSGHILRLPPGFDAATLRRLLAVLQEKPSC
jgi:hypothetical protein